MVEILKDHLRYDEEGNKRIYAPSVIAVKDGEIVGFDDETAADTKGYETPKEYWENEDLGGLRLNSLRCLRILKLIFVLVIVINKKEGNVVTFFFNLKLYLISSLLRILLM